MIQPLSLANYVQRCMRSYLIGLPILASMVAGIAVAWAVVALRASSDLHLTKAIAPHMSTLVETQDRPEMMRVLAGVAEERNVGVLLVQAGRILAGTRGLQELDQEFFLEPGVLSFGASRITSGSLVTTVKVARENGPDTSSQLVILSPLAPLLFSSLGIALAVFALGLILSLLYARGIKTAVRAAIAPIEKLDMAIRNLLQQDDAPLAPAGVLELDRIQSSILETQRALSDATDRLAEAKAKELIAESYRRLIHDLYTPVAALREVSKVIQEAPDDQSIRDRANNRVIRLAEQVLNQVSTAKENLGNEPKILTQADVRRCIAEAAEQALLAFVKRDAVRISQKIPDSPVLVPHDPENLRRAVTNLISNALRACKGVVEVELEKKESSVAIRVSDDGEGINQDDVGLLLQGRLHSKDGNRPGYGLPSANHIARLHGGRLIYRASPLGGACFEIRI